MNGIGYGITPFMGSHGILARSSGGGVTPFVNEYSMSFDGVDEYIDLGTASNLEITDDFSISVWIKDSSALNRGIICCGDRSSTSGWMIYRNSSNKAVFSLYTVNNKNATSTTSINTGTWTNIIATFEKNGTASQQLKIYINGVLEGQGGWLSTQTPTYAGTIYKQIAFPYVGTNEFEGLIDEASIYNRLLTSQEISEISSSPIDLSSYSPLSWWRMGDGDTFSTNWTLIDNGSGGNDATSVSMPEEARLPISPNSFSLNSFSFDGVDEFFNAGNDISRKVQTLTMSVWAKPTAFANDSILLNGNPNYGSQGIEIFWNFNNFRVRINGTNYSIGVGSGQNNWTHIAIAYDGNTLKRMVNGVQGADVVVGATINYTNYNGLKLGRSVYGYHIGYIDEVSFWDSDQSANFSTIYGNGVPTDLTSLSPLNWYRMGEEASWNGSAWTLTDQGSGGNDATSINMEEADKTGDQPYVI